MTDFLASLLPVSLPVALAVALGFVGLALLSIVMLNYIRDQDSPPTAEELSDLSEGDDDPFDSIETPETEAIDSTESSTEDDTSPADPLGPLESIFSALPQFSDDTETAPADGPASPDYNDPLDRVKQYHQNAVKPGDVEHRWRSIRTDNTERQVFFAEPDDISDFLTPGALSELFGNPDLEYDLSIHIRPLDHKRTQKKAEQRKQQLKDAQDTILGDGNSDREFRSSGRERALLEKYSEAINADERPADITITVGARGDTLTELKEDEAKDITNLLWSDPADIGLQAAVGKQDKAIQSLAPIGKDPLGDNDNYTAEALGRGVGALLASINRSTILEDDGIEWGTHTKNGSPIIKNPFNSEKNYNICWIGDSGAGKSYNAKRTIIQIAENLPDTMVILQDPVGGFEGVAKALGAEIIRVGGSRGLNIMEIRQPPDHAIDPADDPGEDKVQEVYGVLSSFANLKDRQLGDRGSTLEMAIRRAYQDHTDIQLDDPTTFDADNPTVADELWTVISDMKDQPEKYTTFEDGTGAETIAEDATWLGQNIIRAFKDGGMSNLGKESQLDLRDKDMIYLDMSQQDGVGQSSLMMQVLWSQIYERAKQTPKDVVLGIDEVEKMMKTSGSMEWLSDRVRRARHWDMSSWFITQDIDDFFKHDGAEVLLNNSHFRVFHNTSEIEEYRDRLGLTQKEAKEIRQAKTGQSGYSTCLYQFGDRKVPAKISALPAAHQVIEFDAQEDTEEDLPGYDPSESPLAAELERRLKHGEHQATEVVDDPGSTDPGPWPGIDGLSDEQRYMLQLLSPSETEDLLRKIEAENIDPETEVKRAVLAKTEQLRGLLDIEDDKTSEVLDIMGNGELDNVEFQRGEA